MVFETIVSRFWQSFISARAESFMPSSTAWWVYESVLGPRDSRTRIGFTGPFWTNTDRYEEPLTVMPSTLAQDKYLLEKTKHILKIRNTFLYDYPQQSLKLV